MATKLISEMTLLELQNLLIDQLLHNFPVGTRSGANANNVSYDAETGRLPSTVTSTTPSKRISKATLKTDLCRFINPDAGTKKAIVKTTKTKSDKAPAALRIIRAAINAIARSEFLVIYKDEENSYYMLPFYAIPENNFVKVEA